MNEKTFITKRLKDLSDLLESGEPIDRGDVIIAFEEYELAKANYIIKLIIEQLTYTDNKEVE